MQNIITISFWYFQEILNHVMHFLFVFQIKNANMILLEKPSHKQFKIMLYFLKDRFLLFLFLFF